MRLYSLYRTFYEDSNYKELMARYTILKLQQTCHQSTYCINALIILKSIKIGRIIEN